MPGPTSGLLSHEALIPKTRMEGCVQQLTAITLGTVEDSINRNLKRWGIRCERRGRRLFCAFCQDGQAKGLVARPVHALGAGKDGVEHRDFVWSEGQVITSLLWIVTPRSKNYAFHNLP